jgi:hypothetical protein
MKLYFVKDLDETLQWSVGGPETKFHKRGVKKRQGDKTQGNEHAWSVRTQ